MHSGCSGPEQRGTGGKGQEEPFVVEWAAEKNGSIQLEGPGGTSKEGCHTNISGGVVLIARTGHGLGSETPIEQGAGDSDLLAEPRQSWPRQGFVH